jgi:hypothetical protein
MTGGVSAKRRYGIYELSSDIPLNWSDLRSMFGYTTLYEISESLSRLTPKILPLFTSINEDQIL